MKKIHKALFVAAATAATLGGGGARAHAHLHHFSAIHKKHTHVASTEGKKKEKLIDEAHTLFDRVKNHPTLLKDMEIAAPLTGMSVDKQLTLIKWEYGGVSLKTPKASAKNSASSATGVMQILDDTFTEAAAKYGERYQEIIAKHYPQVGRELREVLPFLTMKGGVVVLNNKAYNAQAAKGLKGALRYAQKHGQDLGKTKRVFLAQNGSLKNKVLRLRNTPLVSLLFGETALKEEMARQDPTQAKTASIEAIYSAHQWGPSRAQKMDEQPNAPMKRFVSLTTLKNNKVSGEITPARLKLARKKEALVLSQCFREDLAKLRKPLRYVQAVAKAPQSRGFFAKLMGPS